MPCLLNVSAALALVLASQGMAAERKVDTATLAGKLVLGFQGWYTCPNESRPHDRWWHWFTGGGQDADHVHFDLLPDVSELTPSERCVTTLRTPDGREVSLFSDQDPQTVERQFEWLRNYGLDTVALQRFVVSVSAKPKVADRPHVDRVLDNVRKGAERTGRSFFVMYDIAGADPGTWSNDLAEDWRRLEASGLTKSPSYQRHKGRPVLAIAGVGAKTRPGTAEETAALLQRLRDDSAGAGGVTLMASAATDWRTLDGDSKPEAAWADVYRSFDILSPWTVGRYADAASYERFLAQRLTPDIAEAQRAGIDYMPVVFPGFSWRNLFHSARRGEKPLNQIPRQCGRFLWTQVVGDVGAGAGMLYAAMLDEVDEGTALFKLAAGAADLPAQPAMVPLDEPGCNVPSDWYLRLSGKADELLKGWLPAHDQLPLQIPPQP